MNKRNFKITSTGKTILLLMLFFFTIGGILQYLYDTSPNNPLPITQVTKTIQKECLFADKQLEEIKMIVEREKFENLNDYFSIENKAIFFVSKGDTLVFWSTNKISPIKNTPQQWTFITLPNIHTLSRSVKINNYQITAYIPLKYNFPYKNENLENVFLSDISLNKNILIEKELQNKKENGIYLKDGHYLFSLKKPTEPIYNEALAMGAFVFFTLAFILALIFFANLPYWFKRQRFSIKEFVLINLIALGIITLLLGLDIPSTFFANKAFSPYQYSGSFFLKTLIHLSFSSFFFFAQIILFRWYVKRKKNRDENISTYLEAIILLSIPLIILWIIRSFFINIAINSSIELNFFHFLDFSFALGWLHILFLIWGLTIMLSLVAAHKYALRLLPLKQILTLDVILLSIVQIFIFFYFQNWINKSLTLFLFYFILYVHLFFQKHFSEKRFLGIWLIFFIGIYIFNITQIREAKKDEKYQLLAQNHIQLAQENNEKIKTKLFTELQKKIERDKKLHNLLNVSNSSNLVILYFKSTYLKDFWNKYQIDVFSIKKEHKLFNKYNDLIDSLGVKINNTNFYKIKNKKSNLRYIGKFKLPNSDDTFFYLEFYHKKNVRSYSFPNLFSQSKSNLKLNKSLSTATYYNMKLKSSSGEYQYSDLQKWFELNKNHFSKIKEKKYTHYVYTPNFKDYFIISEKNNKSLFYLLFYFIYTFVIYYVCCLIAIDLYKRITNTKEKYLRFFTTKLFFSFTLLIGTGFIMLLSITVFFLQNNYEKQKIIKLQETRRYVQSYLEEKYYWVKKIDNNIENIISDDLTFLSHIYHTDINVYDNSGRLVGSSQPIFFDNKLLSKNLSPLVLSIQSESLIAPESIGNLDYMTAYKRFYNKQSQPIGYIAIPFFLNNNILKSKYKKFVIIVILTHILLIILLILFAIRIIKKLSEPLFLLQEKIKKIKIGKSSKKIDYKPNDEIGLLVNEYNRIVTQLEESALILLQNERESAWRLMAQQIAHEINNPLTPIRLTIQKLQLIKKTKPERFDDVFMKDSEVILEQIDQLKKIVKSFSHFSKKTQTNIETVNIVDTIKSVIILFEKNKEEVIIKHSGLEDNCFILSDEKQLIQVFNNLIKNAIQAIPPYRKGYVDVHLEKNKKTVTIAIKDNGKGIASKDKKRLFEPNFTTKSKGMGLGLGITKNIIESLGGTISFESEIHKGTTFYITIPLSYSQIV